jgi:CheY-like chemotaxis protein
MYIVCPGCGKRLQIPDEKLPSGRSVRITCPACAERFSYDQRFDPGNRLPAEARQGSPAAPGGSTPSSPTEPGGALLAIICLDDPAQQEACHKVLTSLGYAPHIIPNQVKALEALRQIPYRLFILDVAFDGTSPETNIVLTFVRERPLEQRRYLFVALCGAGFMTADAMLAYSQSVNLVINHADVPQCGSVLIQHMAEHERLYRVYRELRQQMGKDI